jgi:hypothetical protein
MPLLLATAFTDDVAAFSAAAAAAAAFAAIFVAWWQLSGLRDEIGLARAELKMSGLMAVLEIESQMSSRKVALDHLSREIQELDRALTTAPADQKPNAQEKINLVKPFFESAVENYLNSVDRLCYCILKEYLADRDWKTEYRNNIHEIIKTYQSSFATGSAFRNTIALDAKWQAT